MRPLALIFFVLISPLICISQNGGPFCAGDISISAGDTTISFVNHDSAISGQSGNAAEISDCRPRIALALSGGGSRGISQIGVLKEFEKAGIQIDYITGTSIGAIIGGLYSAGYSAGELDSIMKASDWGEIFKLAESQERRDVFIGQKEVNDRSQITLRFDNFKFAPPQAASYGAKFNSFLKRLVWNGVYKANGDFGNLKYPFRAVATNLANGQSVSIGSGNLVAAIRASSAIPLRFAPIRKDSMILVDGGLLANMPVYAASEFQPDIIIAVNTTSPILPKDELNAPWNIADQVVSIMMKRFSDSGRVLADIIVEPELAGVKNTDFSDIDMVINKGAEAARKAAPEIKKIIADKKDSLINKEYKRALARAALGNDNNHLLISHSDKEYKIGDGGEFRAFFNNIGREFSEGKVFLRGAENGGMLLETEGFPLINSIKYQGANYLSGPFVDKLSEEYSGARLSPKTCRAVYEQIIKQLRGKGLPFGDISRAAFNGESGALSFDINPGVASSVKTTGNLHANQFLITRELTFEEGEILKIDKILQSWENITNSGLFSGAEIFINRLGQDSGFAVSIIVSEMSTQQISLGLRVDNERNAQAGADLIQENLFNLGARLAIRIAGGSYNQYYGIALSNPRIYKTMAGWSIKGYYQDRAVFTYAPVPGLPRNQYERMRDSSLTEQRFGFDANIGAQIGRDGKFLAGYRFERQRSYVAARGGAPDYYSISPIYFKLIFDTENTAYFPTSGRVIRMSFETNISEGSGAVPFTKAEFYARLNETAGRFTIRPSGWLGAADKTLPPPEFFSLGGQENFYGLREDEERGRQIVRGALEIRYKSPYSLFFDTYFSVRYDLGAVWDVPEQIRFSSLKHGAGASFAWDTPLGPAKFSYGKSFFFVKNPEGVVLGPSLFYFYIGVRI